MPLTYDHDAAHEMSGLLTGCLGARALRARRDELGLLLRPEERRRLRDLERWLAERFGNGADVAGFDSHEIPSRGDARRPVRLHVEFREADGSVREGTICDVSPGGVFVTASRVLRPGERTPLRFVDDTGSEEWLFGAEVAWNSYGPGEPGMGLRFLGIPVEVHLGRRPSMLDDEPPRYSAGAR